MYFLTIVCCVCLNAGANLKRLWRSENRELNYYTKLASCIPEMSFEEILIGELICAKCRDSIDLIYEFREKCLKNKEVLLEYVKKRKENITIKNEIKSENEELCNDSKNILTSNSDVKIKSETKIKSEDIENEQLCNDSKNGTLFNSNIKIESKANDIKVERICDSDYSENNSLCIDLTEDDIGTEKEICCDPKSAPVFNSAIKIKTEAKEIKKENDAAVNTLSGSSEIKVERISESDSSENVPENISLCIDLRKNENVTETGNKILLCNTLQNCDLPFSGIKPKTEVIFIDSDTNDTCYSTNDCTAQIEVEKNHKEDFNKNPVENDVEIKNFSSVLKTGQQDYIVQATCPPEKQSLSLLLENTKLQHIFNSAIDEVHGSIPNVHTAEDQKNFTKMSPSSSPEQSLSIHTVDELTIKGNNVKTKILNFRQSEAENQKNFTKMAPSSSPEQSLSLHSVDELTIKGNSVKRKILNFRKREETFRSPTPEKRLKTLRLNKNRIENEESVKSDNFIPLSHDIIIHMQTCTGSKSFRCSICGKQYQRFENLAKHIRIHLKQNPYECTTCYMRFKDSDTLEKHRTGHTDKNDKKKIFQCEICKKNLSTKGNLERHLQIHGMNFFECEICKKIIKWPEKHMLTHNKEVRNL